MPQSLVQVYVHIIFSTKQRAPYLSDPAGRARLHAYLSGACKGQGCPSLQVGGVEDHVHLLVRLAKTIDVATLIRELKKESSKWVKAELRIHGFSWQTGYGAFSISPSHVESVVEYIRRQELHHRECSFHDEFRRICGKYNVPIDERYVWD
ncbi:MAG: IS200/IS605 family transposase [Planctomycetota bacterium]